MRDLDSYFIDYSQLPYERVQEHLRKQVLVGMLKNQMSKRVVEIGCGRNSIFNVFTDYESGVIIEPIHEFLKLNSHLLSSDNRIAGVNLSVEEFADLRQDQFDVCIVSSLLHEVKNPVDLLKTCRTLLVDSGKILINVPNANSLHRLIGVAKGILLTVHERSATQVKMQQFQTVFDVDSLGALLMNSGYEVTKIFTALLKLLPHAKMHQLLASGAIELETISELERFSSALPEFGSEIFCEAQPTKS